jgi:ABC-type glutathione transport system ATPase component
MEQNNNLEAVVWEIRRVALHEGDNLTLDSTIVALADYLNRQQHELSVGDRRTIMRAAALLWRAGLNVYESNTRHAAPVQH